MKSPEERSLVEILRDMTDQELIVVGVILSPLLFGAWALVLNATISSDAWYWYVIRFVVLFLVLPLLYCQGMLTLRSWETKQEKRQRQRKNLVSRLRFKKGGTASIERIASMDSPPTRELTESDVRELIEVYPGYFASCSMKPKNPEDTGKPGVKLIEDEEKPTSQLG